MNGIFVLGAGRSGTSAMARIVNLLGVPMCVEQDLLGPGPSNKKGFWESRTITLVDGLLLAMVDGAWHCPQEPQEIVDTATPEVFSTCAALFRDLHSTAAWVVKDPRLSVTMPFWRKALGVRPVIVLAVRPPGEVARSVNLQMGLNLTHGYALWERCVRYALHASEGLPTIVAHTREVFGALHEWCDQTAAFLRLQGFAPTGADHDRLDEFVDRSLFRDDVRGLTMSGEQSALWRVLKSLSGHHDSLRRVELPRETPASTALFESLRTRIRAAGFPEPGSRQLYGSRFEGPVAPVYSAVRQAYERR